MFNLSKQSICLLFVTIYFQPATLMADDFPIDTLCPIKTVEQPQKGKIFVWQKNFDAVYDLAMVSETPSGLSPIIRLSFGGSKEPLCHFSSVAVYKGSSWGWHVAWGSTFKPSLMVVRVDGDAWVSSLPKRLESQTADAISFSEIDGLLTLTYHLSSDFPSLIRYMVSSDEGRNWDSVDPHQ
jgi:hypothetical protein